MAISMRFSPYQVLHFIEALHRQQMVNAGVQSHLIENSHTGVHSPIEEKIRCANKHSNIIIHAWKRQKYGTIEGSLPFVVGGVGVTGQYAAVAGRDHVDLVGYTNVGDFAVKSVGQ